MKIFKKCKLSEVALDLPLDVLRKKAKIVVIDDDPNSFPTEILRREGYTIESWERVESLDRLEKGDFDIIVLDIGGIASDYSSRQHEDGFDILEHLKNYNPAQIIVAFSGQSFDLSKNRFWQMADDALSKPADAVKCKEVIDQLLREKLNIAHYWEGLYTILKDVGLSHKQIDNLEHEFTIAISKKDKNSALELFNNAVSGLDISTRSIVIVLRILAICGIA